MNTTVSATGMEVKAKSNNTFLLIGNGTNDTASKIQTLSPASVEVDLQVDAGTAVYPSKPKEANEIGAEVGKLFASGTPVTSATTAAVYSNWYTAQNGNPADSTSAVKNATSLTEENFASYVIKKTVYLTLAKGSETANNLTVTPTIALKSGQESPATNIDAVKVLVACGDNFVILDKTMNSPQSLYSANNTDIDDDNVATVDIYIYYDGSETSVFTNNAAVLAAATVSLAFNVEVKS